jgi:hypothetical protein
MTVSGFDEAYAIGMAMSLDQVIAEILSEESSHGITRTNGVAP